MKNLIFILLTLSLIGCENETSSIKVKNSLSKAIIRNAEWGGIPISSQIFPGETSREITIYEDNYYDINLPNKFPLKFYIDVNGDKVYLETKVLIKLGVDQDITIEISDTTQVINQLLEDI